MPDLCLPKSTRDIIAIVGVSDRHPGLQLDKLSGEHPANEHQQKEALKRVCETKGFPDIFPGWLKRWKDNVATLGATFFDCQTTGPLTLHLSRASALENAGICLHPIYGFVYLPGSGLKGMARAYAETVWKHDDANKAKLHLIEEVFGNQPGEKKQDRQRAGSIVFHDAWPTTWPNLELDIVNCHHRDYYGGKGDSNPPGDWENPIPVNFLAIGPGNTFTFALAKRRADVDGSLIDLAREWLIGALCHMGAGAKTNAGYGTFKVVTESAQSLQTDTRATLEKSRSTYETTLELVTPAFLAGARQDGSDCDLRPATLRGQLRWWWRTMHAGYVDVKTLRAMEAAIWGDTNTGGAVRITVEPISVFKELYLKRSKIGPDYEPSNNKTTQGLFYNSFGMDDSGRQRWYAAPSSKWKVSILARQISKNVPTLSVLSEAKAALWLLCHFGGIGSKSRKGFGSPKDLLDYSFDDCVRSALELRRKMNLIERAERDSDSPVIGKQLPFEDIQTPWKDYWFALDQLGFAVQAFAQKHKHNLDKKALGLPRNVRPPYKGRFNSNLTRHSSPIHCHFAHNDQGKLVIRMVIFPANRLPDINTSREFLTTFRDEVAAGLKARVEKNKNKGLGVPALPAKGNAQSHTPSQKLPARESIVKGQLLSEKTKKGGWKVKLADSGIEWHIHNSSDVPPDRQVGDEIDVLVRESSQDGNKIHLQLEYPRPGEKQPPPPPRPSGGKGGGKGQHHNRGRR